MFGKRELSVQLRKTNDHEEFDEDELTIFEDKLALTHVVVRDIVRNIIVGVCAYVVLDTARQILVKNITVQDET